MNYNCGIYIITNTANGKRYVGSSKRIDRRLSHHKWSLRSNRHHSVALQRAWNKYGEESFSFGVAAYVSESDRIWYEQTFLDSLETYLPANGYNLCKKADAPGSFERSEESRIKYKQARQNIAERFDVRGEMLTREEIMNKYGLRPKVLEGRLSRNWPMEEIISTPMKAKPREEYEFNGKSQDLFAWAEDIGVSYSTLNQRRTKGWSVERMLTTPAEVNLNELTFDGKTMGVTAWDREMGYPIGTISTRITHLGWDVDRAITQRPVSVRLTSDPTASRKCVKCEETKTAGDFYWCKGLPRGRVCKACTAKLDKERRMAA